MLIAEMASAFGQVKPVPERGTPLGDTAAEIREMILCYAADGEVFFRKGDLVNAAAAFAYGSGWLDAGICLGYLTGERRVFSGPDERLPEHLSDHLSDHLSEKTGRYRKMLERAVASVYILPDTETVLYHAAEHVLKQAETGFQRGVLMLPDELHALCCFSYGYGWLDAGVRSGLFGIRENRELFTI
jgi:hypothetical protein